MVCFPEGLLGDLTGLLLPLGSFVDRSKCLVGRGYDCFLVELIGTDDCVLLVGLDGNDAHGPWHLEDVVGIV